MKKYDGYTRKELRDELDRLATIQKAKFMGVIQEYVEEAEHQDGVEYWEQFSDLNQIAKDFKFYVEGANEKNPFERKD